MSFARLCRALHAKRDAAKGQARVADIDREMGAAIARRKAERIARADAAKRGVSTQWRRRGEAARAMFGGGA